MTRILFASGPGRCGTQTLGTQLGNIKGVYSFHEGISLWKFVRTKCPPAPHLCWAENLDMTRYNEQALEYRTKIFLAGQKAYVEAAHYFAPNIDLVEDEFPSAKIIHLYRNPIEVINSYLSHAQWRIYHEGKHERSKKMWTWWGDCFPVNKLIHSREEGFAYYWQLANTSLANSRLERLLVHTRELKSAETWKKILDFGEIEGSIPNPKLVYNPTPPKHLRLEVTDAVRAAAEKFCTWRP